MEHPIDYYRIQKASKVDKAIPVRFNTYIQTYEAVRQGQITDVGIIRETARQFAAIADMPGVNGWFPYDAHRIAAALDSCALTLEMKASAGSGGQSGSHATQAEPSPPKFTDEITVDLVKMREELLYISNAQEGHEKVPLADRNSIKKSESNNAKREDDNTDPEKPIDADNIPDQWEVLLKFVEIAEQEGKKLAAKGIVKGPIDHDDLWKEWGM